jgi:hypothetical protein
LVKEMKTSRGVGRIRKKHLSRKKRKTKSKGKNSRKNKKK